MEQKNVGNYTLYREKFVNKCRNNSNFRRAVEEMDNFISNPLKYRANAVARVIKIKTEEEIQSHLGIKVEFSDDVGKNKNESATLTDKSKIESLMKEKSKLIAEIISLKTENQRTCFDLNERQVELVTIKTENERKIRELNERIIIISSSLKNAEAEILKLKKSISDLVSEKNIQKARIKQLLNSSASNSSQKARQNSVDENVFEVEKVISDKLVGKTRYYLVHWKGYSSKDDTWEREENLFCPTILEEYRQSKSN